MAMRRIPGLSLAIVDGGKIVSSRAYGVTDRGSNRPVTLNTVFQAGSISKSVAAFGALHLVEEGKLALDTDVNATLKSWKLPASTFTATKPVTLRGILSHTAGLTVHGFPGYDADSTMPTLVQVLNGTAPTNTAAIRNDIEPGTRWRYSGGGYTIMQQMVIDVTGKSFPDYMQRAVLGPLGMEQSSYEQPPRGELATLTAAGHYLDGRVVHKRWHVYPEMAAAGLWTTPSDLARFAIGVQQAYAGKSSKVISQSMAKQMLTDQKDNDGLGVFLQGSGQSLWFSHNGRDEGFDASLNAAAETGQAVAIMINANDNSGAVPRIAAFIAKKYHWPNASNYVPPTAAAVSESQLAAVTGRYEMANNQMATLVSLKGHLYGASDGRPDEAFIPLGNDTFASADRDVRLAFKRDASGVVVSVTRTQGSNTRTAPRIGPLFTELTQQTNEDIALTKRVEAVVRALGQGSPALTAVQGITEGARKDFNNAWEPAAGLTQLSFVAAQDISTRGIERHGSKVARILYYRMTAHGVESRLLVHLTADGLVTDVDIADE
jgi:CubicO group peptidase (beta-lactamase class C family)